MPETAPEWQRRPVPHSVDCQREAFDVMTLRDALTAYKTYARAEGKSEKTVRWVTSSVSYLGQFLGQDQQVIAGIVSDDLRRFTIALQRKQKFSEHPYTKPQQASLSPTAINTYLRGIRNFFGFLVREGFLDASPMKGLKIPKALELVVPTFSEKEMERLLDQPDKHSNQGPLRWPILRSTGRRVW